MNIFAVDLDPVVSAQSLHDRHVVKMTLETCQMLCTIQTLSGRLQTVDGDYFLKGHKLYRPTHANHPCTVWARGTRQNYAWLSEHGLALADEYYFRFGVFKGKTHASADLLKVLHLNPPKLPNLGLSPHAQAMPEEFKSPSYIRAYRNLYRGVKTEGNTWTRRNPPSWLVKHFVWSD